MAEVLLARRTPDDGAAPELVVIKRVLPHLTQADGFMKMFATESRIASQLRHPNIVSVVEVGEMDALPFIAMERLDGADLLRLLQQCVLRRQQLGTIVAMAVVSGAARGLGYAHRARARDGRPLKIIHRDVSPHNIFVTRDGGVKLLDFGIAKSAAHATNTHTGQVKGKISYMSPEQIRARPLDARSDLWSLGVVLWESVAGEKLFTRDNDAATLHAILHDPIPRLERRDAPGLDDLIAAILHRDPVQRIASAEEIAQRLDALLAQTGHASPSRLIAQRVASLVPALNPEVDLARPAQQRNPEVVTFAVGPSVAKRDAPAADRAGPHRRLSIAPAPVEPVRVDDDHDDPTLMEIAAPPPDPDFDADETIDRAASAPVPRPLLSETTDTHTIPLRPAILATGTAGAPRAEPRAAPRGAVSVPSARSTQHHAGAPPVSDSIPEISVELELDADDNFTAPVRRPPTLSPPRGPVKKPTLPPSVRANPAPLHNPLSNRPATAAAPAAKSSPPSVPVSSSAPAAMHVVSAATVPPSSKPLNTPPRVEAPKPQPPPVNLKPVDDSASGLSAIFGATPPLPAKTSPFDDIPPLRAVSTPSPATKSGRPTPMPLPATVSTLPPPRPMADTLVAAEVPTTPGRRTQRVTARHGAPVPLMVFGGLCFVAGLVVFGAWASGALRPSSTTAALHPAATPPAAVTVLPPPAAPTATPTATPTPPEVAMRPEAPQTPAAPEPPEASPPEPVAAPEPVAPPPPRTVAAAPQPAVVRPVAPRVVVPAPAPRPAPAQTAHVAAPHTAPSAPTPRPAAPVRRTGVDPFDSLVGAPPRTQPTRVATPRPTPAPVRAPTPTPAPTRPTPTRAPPSLRQGGIFHDL